jgi:hypothetical protein
MSSWHEEEPTPASSSFSVVGRYHLGGGEPDLRVIPVVDGLQQLFAQAVDGDYVIVRFVTSIQRVGFERPSDREDIDYLDRGQFGLQY